MGETDRVGGWGEEGKVSLPEGDTGGDSAVVMFNGWIGYACMSAGSVSWKGPDLSASVAGQGRRDGKSVLAFAEARRYSTI